MDKNKLFNHTHSLENTLLDSSEQVRRLHRKYVLELLFNLWFINLHKNNV